MGDTSKHLTYFKVENFKRFESFEMKDLGQFNLIVGDNNVGKTSVLEALLIDSESYHTFNNLAGALEFRNFKHDLKYGDLDVYLNKSIRSSKIDFRLSYFDKQEYGYSITINRANHVVKFYAEIPSAPPNTYEVQIIQDFSYNDFYPLPFVPFYRGHDESLTKFYSRLQKSQSLKNRFIKSLGILVPDLVNIELSAESKTPYLIMYQNHIDATIPLAFFGDGVLKLFRLLAEIIINNGKRLMIDEVDTGIHFSHFKEFWKVILQTAKDNDVQLFMTTHNEECIRYFKEVLEEDLPNLKEDVRNITLVENAKTKVVTAHTYNYEQFEHTLDVGNEIRS